MSGRVFDNFFQSSTATNLIASETISAGTWGPSFFDSKRLLRVINSENLSVTAIIDGGKLILFSNGGFPSFILNYNYTGLSQSNSFMNLLININIISGSPSTLRMILTDINGKIGSIIGTLQSNMITWDTSQINAEPNFLINSISSMEILVSSNTQQLQIGPITSQIIPSGGGGIINGKIENACGY